MYYNAVGEPFPYTPPSADQNHTLVIHDAVLLLSGQTSGSAGYSVNRSLQLAVTLDGGKTWRRQLKALKPGGTGYQSKQVFDSFILDDGSGTTRLFHSGANTLGGALNLNIQIGLATASSVTSLVV